MSRINLKCNYQGYSRADIKDKPVATKVGLDYCNRLFAIERELKDVSTQERYNKRLKHSKQLPNVNTGDQTFLDSLLPWSDALPDNCKLPHQDNTTSTAS